jgi:PAS domain S-box-containing protein
MVFWREIVGRSFVMIQRRKIAIAYAFAIPILLGVLFFEVGALFRLNAHEGEIVQEISAVHDCDDLLSALRDAETAARGYVAGGSDSDKSEYGDATSRLNSSLRQLDALSKNDPKIQSRLQQLDALAAKRLGMLDRAMDSRNTRQIATRVPSTDIQGSDVTAAIGKIVAVSLADEERRSQQEQASVARSASSVDTLVKYGGVLTIWMVSVAALLLFYDDMERSRERVEQRLHTDVLDSLPLGVCLATESGVILYANPAADSTFGYKPGELVARNIALLHDLNETGAEARVVEILAQLLPREIWSGELPLRTRDGDIVRTDSWIASIRVGEKDCRLLVHGTPVSGSLQQQSHLGNQFTPPREGAEGTAAPPRALVPGGLELTRSLDSEAIGMSGRAK